MIPQGWQEKKLTDVINKVTYTSKIQSKQYKEKGAYPIISQEDIFISGYWDNPDDVYIVKHPIIIFGDHTKVVKYVDFDFVLGADGVKILDPLPLINAKFLYYWTKFIPLRNLGYARHYKLLADKMVCYPPLSEQERIVAKLDKAFEAIDKVKANAEQNLNNAKEIYNIKKELIFKTVLENKPVEFGDIIELLTDYHANGSYKLLKEHVELLDNENYAWMIRSTDFENEFKNNFKYINEKAYNFLEKTKIFGNEIIMSKIGNAGKIYLMPVVNRPVSLAMNLFLIRVKEKLAISSYVYRFLLTNIGQKQINERCKGAATQTITKDNVRSIKIYLPNTLSEQQKIVEKLDALQEQTKQLEQIYTQKIKKCDELKQSILQKAFRGEL